MCVDGECMSLVVRSDNRIRLISLLALFFTDGYVSSKLCWLLDFALSNPFSYFHSYNLSLNWIFSLFRIQTFIPNGKYTMKCIRMNFTNTVSSIQPESGYSPILILWYRRVKKEREREKRKKKNYYYNLCSIVRIYDFIICVGFEGTSVTLAALSNNCEFTLYDMLRRKMNEWRLFIFIVEWTHTQWILSFFLAQMVLDAHQC